MTRVVLTAVIAPPPHLVAKGARQERLNKHCEMREVAAAVAEFVELTERFQVFDAGGALTVLVQRAPVEVAP